MLMRFDPFRDLDRFTEFGHRTLAMDAFRRGQEFVVQLDLPGADPTSVDVSVERNVLTIRAERVATREEGDQVVIAERRFGTFTRQFFLGDTLDRDNIAADYANGVLTVTIPLSEKAQARSIAVTTAA